MNMGVIQFKSLRKVNKKNIKTLCLL